MELKDLIGRKKLDAVSFSDSTDRFGSARVVKFRLDGVVHCAVEDEDDGYRSSLGELIVFDHDDIDNAFPSIDVDCVYEPDAELDLLSIFDIQTRELVLQVGTDYTGGYYPYFVARFFPEAMCINRGVA